MLIGNPGARLIAELVVGNARRRIERPIVRLQFDGAVQELNGVGEAVLLHQKFSIFADHTRIIGSRHHQLAEYARCAFRIALRAQEPCLLNGTFHIGRR